MMLLVNCRVGESLIIGDDVKLTTLGDNKER
jgi:sRNA-binding carbon storage regulator CsrA